MEGNQTDLLQELKIKNEFYCKNQPSCLSWL